jgi:hypothetical protein
MYHIVSYCITKSDRVCRPRKRESGCHLPTDRFALSCERVLSNSAFSLQPRAHPLGLRRLSHKCLFLFFFAITCEKSSSESQERRGHRTRATRQLWSPSSCLQEWDDFSRSGGACAAERKEAGKGIFFFESAVDFSFEKSPKVCLLT